MKLQDKQLKKIISNLIDDRSWANYWNDVREFPLYLFFDNNGNLVEHPKEVYRTIVKELDAKESKRD